MHELRFPIAVRGPVLLLAFRRLAATRFDELMVYNP
jgi:hypothetical protein